MSFGVLQFGGTGFRRSESSDLMQPITKRFYRSMYVTLLDFFEAHPMP